MTRAIPADRSAWIMLGGGQSHMADVSCSGKTTVPQFQSFAAATLTEAPTERTASCSNRHFKKYIFVSKSCSWNSLPRQVNHNETGKKKKGYIGELVDAPLENSGALFSVQCGRQLRDTPRSQHSARLRPFHGSDQSMERTCGRKKGEKNKKTNKRCTLIDYTCERFSVIGITILQTIESATHI
jgi:hypothetical protein